MCTSTEDEVTTMKSQEEKKRTKSSETFLVSKTSIIFMVAFYVEVKVLNIGSNKIQNK